MPLHPTACELAQLVGVSRQTMNAIENGRHAPTVDVAIRIAYVFGTTVDQLFDLDDVARPAHRKKGATMPVARSEATGEEPVGVERDNEPAKTAAKKEISLASLRKVIG